MRTPALVIVLFTAAISPERGAAQARPGTPPPATLRTEKRLILQTLAGLSAALDTFRVHHSDLAGSNAVSQADTDLRWLLSAAQAWEPRSESDGRRFRESLELMLATIRQAAADTSASVPITLAALDDLNAKKDHCRAAGLGAEARVEVKTKRQGLEEVKGLEVWYLEQFRALDPSATPHRFKSFSSPAAEQIVPGRYLFWARHPGSGQTGAKTEQRIAAAPGTTIRSQPFRVEIEVLAP